MYELEYLPAAQRDMVEAVRYISEELRNTVAANQLAAELIKAGDSILDFPYANPVYTPARPLKYEYRKILIRNYLMFYRVDEGKRLVSVARVVYARRNYESLLE